MKLYSLLMLLATLSACSSRVFLAAANGVQGESGSNGHSAVFNTVPADNSLCQNNGTILSAGVDTNDDTILQVSETKSVVIICNGRDGRDGTDAVLPPFTPVGVLNPCGDAPGIYDEVFLKLSNGQIMASFSDNANGLNIRFGILIPGSYITTDGDGCTFTIDGSNNITNENKHY